MADAVSGCCMQRAGAYACSVSGLFPRSRCVRSERQRTRTSARAPLQTPPERSPSRSATGPATPVLPGFWASRSGAHDDFDLVKLAHLYGYSQERIQQAAFAIADNASHLNAFFSQRGDRLRIGRVGFPLNCYNCQGALAHDAPLLAEISGVHDEVYGCLWQCAIGLCSGFGKVTADGFEAASVLRGKLGGALLAFAVAPPKGVGI